MSSQQEQSHQVTSSKSLCLRDQTIRVISGINHLFYLESLDLSNNQIVKMQNIDRLCLLQNLDLSHNKIVFIENIATLTHLKYLSLAHNAIQIIPSAITNNVCLENLDLSHNQINNQDCFLFLHKLIHLEQLNLQYNPISQLQNYSEKIMKCLPGLDILDNRTFSKKQNTLNAIFESFFDDKENLANQNNPNKVLNDSVFKDKISLNSSIARQNIIKSLQHLSSKQINKKKMVQNSVNLPQSVSLADINDTARSHLSPENIPSKRNNKVPLFRQLESEDLKEDSLTIAVDSSQSQKSNRDNTSSIGNTFSSEETSIGKVMTIRSTSPEKQRKQRSTNSQFHLDLKNNKQISLAVSPFQEPHDQQDQQELEKNQNLGKNQLNCVQESIINNQEKQEIKKNSQEEENNTSFKQQATSKDPTKRSKLHQWRKNIEDSIRKINEILSKNISTVDREAEISQLKSKLQSQGKCKEFLEKIISLIAHTTQVANLNKQIIAKRKQVIKELLQQCDKQQLKQSKESYEDNDSSNDEQTAATVQKNCEQIIFVLYNMRGKVKKEQNASVDISLIEILFQLITDQSNSYMSLKKNDLRGKQLTQSVLQDGSSQQLNTSIQEFLDNSKSESLNELSQTPTQNKSVNDLLFSCSTGNRYLQVDQVEGKDNFLVEQTDNAQYQTKSSNQEDSDDQVPLDSDKIMSKLNGIDHDFECQIEKINIGQFPFDVMTSTAETGTTSSTCFNTSNINDPHRNCREALQQCQNELQELKLNFKKELELSQQQYEAEKTKNKLLVNEEDLFHILNDALHGQEELSLLNKQISSRIAEHNNYLVRYLQSSPSSTKNQDSTEFFRIIMTQQAQTNESLMRSNQEFQKMYTSLLRLVEDKTLPQMKLTKRIDISTQTAFSAIHNINNNADTNNVLSSTDNSSEFRSQISDTPQFFYQSSRRKDDNNNHEDHQQTTHSKYYRSPRDNNNTNIHQGTTVCSEFLEGIIKQDINPSSKNIDQNLENDLNNSVQLAHNSSISSSTSQKPPPASHTYFTYHRSSSSSRPNNNIISNTKNQNEQQQSSCRVSSPKLRGNSILNTNSTTLISQRSSFSQSDLNNYKVDLINKKLKSNNNIQHLSKQLQLPLRERLQTEHTSLLIGGKNSKCITVTPRHTNSKCNSFFHKRILDREQQQQQQSSGCCSLLKNSMSESSMDAHQSYFSSKNTHNTSKQLSQTITKNLIKARESVKCMQTETTKQRISSGGVSQQTTPQCTPREIISSNGLRESQSKQQLQQQQQDEQGLMQQQKQLQQRASLQFVPHNLSKKQNQTKSTSNSIFQLVSSPKEAAATTSEVNPYQMTFQKDNQYISTKQLAQQQEIQQSQEGNRSQSCYTKPAQSLDSDAISFKIAPPF